MRAGPVQQLHRKYGGQGGSRTPDTGIFSPLLYRLSYLPKRSRHRDGRTYRRVPSRCQDIFFHFPMSLGWA